MTPVTDKTDSVEEVSDERLEALRLEFWRQSSARGIAIFNALTELRDRRSIANTAGEPSAWLLHRVVDGEITDIKVSLFPISDGDRSYGWTDKPLYADPTSTQAGAGRPTYEQISTMVHACRERQKAAGEGDQMLSRWISEGLDGLHPAPQHNDVREALAKNTTFLDAKDADGNVIGKQAIILFPAGTEHEMEVLWPMLAALKKAGA